MTAAPTVPRVSPNGRDLLLVARAIVQGGPYEAVESILLQETPMTGVGAGTMRLFEETLALGCVHQLALLGGWRREARVSGDDVATGRLWEVRRESPLAFSPFAFELCRWLVARPLGGAKVTPLRSAPRTAGDELVAYLACALVEQQPLERRLAEQPGLRASALAWLGFPAMLGEVEQASADMPPERFEALARDGAVVLEAVSRDLARRAVGYERAKAAIFAPDGLRRLGDARDRALGLLLDAVERVHRWDLATFLVASAAELLPPTSTARDVAAQLVGPLDPRASLRDRADAVRASGAHLRHLARVGRHHEALRQVRHFDEGYAPAQLLLARWEDLGNDGFSRAADALAGLEALDRG